MDKPIVVLDTSFFVDWKAHQYWTEPFDQDSEFHFVEVSATPSEYKNLIANRKDLQRSIVIGPKESTITIKVELYDNPLREDFDSKLQLGRDFFEQRGSPLSTIDKLIVQCAHDFAKESKHVGVATADKGIEDVITMIGSIENLDMAVYSPWQTPQRHNVDLLVSEIVFDKLRQIPDDPTLRIYLAVQKNMHIGGGVRFDIAADVYTNNRPVLPSLPDAYFIMLAPTSSTFKPIMETKSAEYFEFGTWMRLFSHSYFAKYDSQYPLAISITHISRPLTDRERFKYNEKIRKGTITRQDSEALRARPKSHVHWARIDDKYIKSHDPLTLGLLEEFRRNLRKY